jgi:hypothetical protein
MMQITALRAGVAGRSYRLSPLPQRPVVLQSYLAEDLVIEAVVVDALEYTLPVQGAIRG